MAEKTQKQLIQEVHQGLYGVKGTADKGLTGDFKDLVIELKKINGRVSRNSRLVFIMVGALIASGVLGGLELADVIHLLGG